MGILSVDLLITLQILPPSANWWKSSPQWPISCWSTLMRLIHQTAGRYLGTPLCLLR
uniref:Uncharacterized protein n=1 Tax=Colobus angolensis palliatus TaxID=336983 RepID=A0A2K5HKV8_COLAP